MVGVVKTMCITRHNHAIKTGQRPSNTKWLAFL